MNTVKTINTLLIAALALGSLASTATVAYQVSTATANQAETAVSAFVRDSEVAQARGPQNDEAGRAFYLAHELGHVLDAQDSPLHLFLGEVSQAFSCNIDAYTDERGVYHLGRTYPLRDPRDRPRHRMDNAAEDWAESFATVVVPAFEADLRDIGDAREQEVQHLLVLWVEQIEARQQRLPPRVTRR
jgi:hypothetical protein